MKILKQIGFELPAGTEDASELLVSLDQDRDVMIRQGDDTVILSLFQLHQMLSHLESNAWSVLDPSKEG